jgi:soluble lytic murein transglycosylase-like protein
VNVVWIGVAGYLGHAIVKEKEMIKTVTVLSTQCEEYKIKQEILTILKVKGISLGQGLDIADMVIEQTNNLNLPVSLVLAVMKKESEFYPNAKSNKNAMGIMQIMPTMWSDYVKKLKLDVSLQAAFDPLVNIKVGTRILKDLYDTYKLKSKTESEVWKLTLSAYNAGPNNGIQHSYVKDVNKFQKEFDIKLFTN